MANYLEIDEARRILNLTETATINEIKNTYRRLARSYHPDHNTKNNQDQETMKRLNWAYKVLSDYCKDYKYSFTQEDVARTYPYEEYMRNWRDNWYNSI